MAVPDINIDPPTHINDLPPAPVRGEPFEQFTAKANAFVAAQNPWGQEANALADYMESTALAAEAFANYTRDQAENAELAVISAGAFSQESQAWSEKRGSSVIDDEWSAAEHAVGDYVPTGSAKAWAAAPRNEVVADGLYSARHYTLEAEGFKDTAESAAAAAQAGAGLPAISGNPRGQLTVNGAANGVEWIAPMFNWWDSPNEIVSLATFLTGVFSDKVLDHGDVSGPITIDVSEAGEQKIRMTGNTVVTLIGQNAEADRTSSCTLLVERGAAGLSLSFAGGTIRFPGGIVLPTTDVNAVDRWFIMTSDEGVNWDLSIPQADLKT